MLAGLLSAAGDIGDSWTKFNQQMDLMKQKLEMESTQRRADKTWEMEQQDLRRNTKGTAENQAMVLNDFKIDEAKRQQGLINMRREGSVKREDGGFDVLGDDGMVRSTDAQGNLIGSARDARTYEGMSSRDIRKQDMEMQAAELRLQQARQSLGNMGKDDARRKELQDAIRYAMHYKSVLESKPGDETAIARYNEALAEVAALTGKIPEEKVEYVTKKTATKSMDSQGNEVTESTEQKVPVKRQSWKGQPTAENVGAPTGKRVVVNGKEGEYVMKDGKKFFVPYK